MAVAFLTCCFLQVLDELAMTAQDDDAGLFLRIDWEGGPEFGHHAVCCQAQGQCPGKASSEAFVMSEYIWARLKVCKLCMRVLCKGLEGML